MKKLILTTVFLAGFATLSMSFSSVLIEEKKQNIPTEFVVAWFVRTTSGEVIPFATIDCVNEHIFYNGGTFVGGGYAMPNEIWYCS